MKKFFIVLFLWKLSYIKSQEHNADQNSINTIIGFIDKRDSNCLFEIKKAKIDFKSQEIYYHIIPEGYLDTDSNRHHQILGALLTKKGIRFLTSTEPEFDSFWSDGNGEKYQLQTNCYCKSFNELLNLKYGRSFTKNIERTADSLYVISRIDQPFNYPYGVDNYCMIYPNAKDFLDQKEQIRKDFLVNFKFPDDFIYSGKERDFMAKSKFTITKESTISNVTIQVEFKNESNQKFQEYIINSITEFIKNANWKAAISSGVKVNSLFEVNFYN
ncbi:hypothetical protein [Flavobacterium hungaricum]|uniref:Uncharacterized protein n=1 Tax=Flavobacterium hungaricum TaxID=2082725 RepID=A0ABR9TS25_9FLAO|nr:hypothetical protein [Flavobacterium hungaricum]MBE8728140.1 hypothetical protein [Flavobacterium hungaricum]